MKLKEFFKSITFRCIFVLFCIALVSGGLLSILNDVLAVSEDEEEQRMLASIYNVPGVSVVMKEDIPYDDATAKTDRGYVEKYLLLSDGNVIIRSVGMDGYHGGTVSLWVATQLQQGEYVGILNVSVADNQGQSFIGEINEKYLEQFKGDGEVVSTASPAPFTKNAIVNGVNSAVSFAKSRSFVKGGSAA